MSLDEYVKRYPELGPTESLSVDLIYEEFRIRHRHGDKPPLEVYRKCSPLSSSSCDNWEKKDPVAQTLQHRAAGCQKTTGTEHDSECYPGRDDGTGTANTEATAAPLFQLWFVGTPGEGPQTSDGYQLLERIGKGQFGEGYRGLAPGGVIVAIKRNSTLH